ncbi:hypothetical protein MKEN_00037500 [Mycena kentingensis (nom. inval.)]|nr:hypothetical protein MKEN_00037500 [Mycena kentingensis (nom. inval.)]
MHINAHIVLCRLLFSLALILGSGMTDGEGIERLWAATAGVAGSTKLSGHGARADQLDDHWSFWNWSKLVGLAKLLRRRLANAKIEAKKQEDSFRVFIRSRRSMSGIGWRCAPDMMTEADLRKTLEEEDRSARDGGSIPLHSVGPSEFIVFGLELESQQRNLRVQAQMKRHGTTAEPIRLRPLRKKLGKSIKRLRDLQATYTPTALTHLASLDLSDNILAEDIPLLLPSSIPPSLREGCKDGLLEIEARLRHAQCQSALAQLRHQLHIKARLLIYKKLQLRHQGMNTRSRALVARNEQKIKSHSDLYQAARAALCQIESAVVWPPLLASDIRCLEDPDDISKREARNRRQVETRLRRQVELLEAGLIMEEDVKEQMGETDSEDEPGEEQHPQKSSGESRRTISWIWTVAGTTGTDATLLDSLRVEWSRAYARTRRWREEIRLLEEEIRCLPLSLRHEERIWNERGAEALGGDRRLQEGRVAYAAKQAAMYREIAWRAELIQVEEWQGKGHRKYAERRRLNEEVEMEDEKRDEEGDSDSEKEAEETDEGEEETDEETDEETNEETDEEDESD